MNHKTAHKDYAPEINKDHAIKVRLSGPQTDSPRMTMLEADALARYYLNTQTHQRRQQTYKDHALHAQT